MKSLPVISISISYKKSFVIRHLWACFALTGTTTTTTTHNLDLVLASY